MNIAAEPSLDIHTTHYSVTGDTEAEIRQSMNMNTTAIKDGMRYDALTLWDIELRYSTREIDGECELTDVSTKLKVIYTFPQHISLSNLPAALKLKWKQYFDALVAHENGHMRFAYSAAFAIENELLKFEKRKSCALLEKDIKSLKHRIRMQFHALEKKYDQETQHGAIQGVIFLQ